MKILFLAYSYGGSASGKITQRIVEELNRRGCNVRVIVAECTNKDDEGNVIALKNILDKFPKLSYLRIKLLTAIGFSAYNSNFIWRYRVKRYVSKLLKSWCPDYIFCRSTPIDPCLVGTEIHLNTGIPVYQHFSDPLPAPSSPDNAVRARFVKQSEYIIRYSNVVSFGTKQMGDYIQTLIKYDFSHKFSVIPDVTISVSHFPPDILPFSSTIKMVYLGTIYGTRNPYPLFHALDLLEQKGITCELFIYSKPPIKRNESKHIRYMGYTNDVESALKEANILVDIDGDDKIPVFISSKLKDYIISYRPILSITPDASPSQILLKDQKTVVVTINDEYCIVDSIERILSNTYTVEDYNERHCLAKQFSPEVVIADIIKNIQLSENEL